MQPRRQVARLGEQEQADLRDVGAGGDVHEVVFALGVERVGAREVVERLVDLLEVPRIGEVDHGADAPRSPARPCAMSAATVSASDFSRGCVKQLEAIHEQIVVLAERDRRAPVLPAAAFLARRRAWCRGGRSTIA